jgi:H+/gluconate symporter-like permease
VLGILGETYMKLAAEHGIDPSLLHRVTTIGAGTLDALPHNGTVLLLFQISGLTHRESYFDMVMTVIVTCVIALGAVLVLGTVFGSF